MDKPLKILMILHMPWTRDLGAPRVSVEIADEFVRMGHQVDKFDIDDAFPRKGRLTPFFDQALFSRRAVAYVRQQGRRYDVIQAEHGNLPVTKRQLNYPGVLIARTNGLAHFYADYLQAEARRKREQGIREGTFLGNTMRRIAEGITPGLPGVERSFAAADAIIVINREELEYVSTHLGHRGKTVLLPNGLSEARHAEFAARRTPPGQRQAAQQIAFVGSWGDRKGARDFPALARQVRSAAPEARFLFLGTGGDQESISAHFDPADRANITVIPRYASAELPALLSEATAGVLPAYIEGFPFAVLELCAAGIPTLAYDVPGPREMLRHFDAPLLTPPGDVEAAAQRLVALLKLSVADYTALSERAVEIAGRFRWPNIAQDMLDLYERKRDESGIGN